MVSRQDRKTFHLTLTFTLASKAVVAAQQLFGRRRHCLFIQWYVPPVACSLTPAANIAPSCCVESRLTSHRMPTSQNDAVVGCFGFVRKGTAESRELSCELHIQRSLCFCCVDGERWKSVSPCEKGRVKTVAAEPHFSRHDDV